MCCSLGMKTLQPDIIGVTHYYYFYNIKQQFFRLKIYSMNSIQILGLLHFGLVELAKTAMVITRGASAEQSA
jgi:hypothetical protein